MAKTEAEPVLKLTTYDNLIYERYCVILGLLYLPYPVRMKLL